jgi:fructokinase
VTHLISSAASPVLVIGEALIDIVTPEGLPSAEHVGGSPANVALGLGRLGIPVRLRTALGRDARGARLATHLAASGVEVEPESFALHHTSTATARISAQGDAFYDFDLDWQISGPIELRGARSIHVGSIGCFVEPGASSVRDAIRLWPRKVLVTFDPNTRPALVGDQSSALYVTEEIASRSDVVKLSDEDAAWLYPGATVDEVLDRLLTLGARVVAMTLGGDGATIASRRARVIVAPITVPVKDTVGAGDTFMSSLIATLAEHRLNSDEESLRAAGERAAVAAAITVGRIGADPPTRMELDAALVASAV